ncbi:uncharacterized protein LOC141905783 [Tubulanus polymorphus]|uniref:uncharacterized protein LOC141905783 n=1 Tax=Tubulanus polymorphus TaxID=672921 RepID=UPI003DA2FBBC
MENNELDDSFDEPFFSELSHSHSTGNLAESLHSGSDSGSDIAPSESVVSLSDSETNYVPYQANRLLRRRGSAPPAVLEHLKTAFPLTQKQIVEEDESANGEAKYSPKTAPAFSSKRYITRRGSLPPAFSSEKKSVRDSATDRKTQEFGSTSMSQPYHSAILNRFYQRLNSVPPPAQSLHRRSSTEDLNEVYKKIGIDNDLNPATPSTQPAAHSSNFLSLLGVAGFKKPTTPEIKRKGYWLSSMFVPATPAVNEDVGAVKKAVSEIPVKKSLRRRDINCFAPTSM